MGWLGIEGQVLRAEPGQADCTDAVGLRWAVLVFKGTAPHAASLEIAVSQQGGKRGVPRASRGSYQGQEVSGTPMIIVKTTKGPQPLQTVLV